LAANPIAIPAIAAPSSGPALSPQEKALRSLLFPLRLLEELSFELELRVLDPRLRLLFVGRLWVRVAMYILLGLDLPHQHSGEGPRS